MSQPCYENESNNRNEEGNAALFSTPHELIALRRDSKSSSPFEETGNQSNDDTQNQLVLYDSKGNDTEEVKHLHSNPRLFSSSRTSQPSIGAFTVQCASCFKWRLIPTMQKYEEIREHVLEKPFFCETAREWRPDISCDDPTDLSQDGSRLWAIDKPSIARPPVGWQRLLRIRGEGGTRFADVYYVTPSGKKLRSTVEVQKYLNDHPEYIREGVKLSQFSFQIPKPLQDNYVRKRPARLMDSSENTKNPGTTEASPLAWISPDDHTALKLGMPNQHGLYDSHDPPSKMSRKSSPPTSSFGGDCAVYEPKIELDKKTEPSTDGC